jgi:hypothetical protein
MTEPQTRATDAAQIEPSDVLLFHGNSFVSWAIRRFDGSDVNHAALAIDATTMIEAAGQGLRSAPIADAVAGNERTYIRRLEGADDLSAVVAMGKGYLSKGVPYAYHQIALLGFLSISRKLSIGNPLLRRVLRVALDKAAQLLNALVEDGTELMICSEYVFRCYGDTKDPRFALEILPPDQRPQMLATPVDIRLLDWARQQPEPTLATSTAGEPRMEPDAIAKQAEAELEPLIENYARTEVPDDPEVMMLPPSPATLDVGPPVSNEELNGAAVSFRDAALAHERARGTVEPAAMALDPWEAFETVPDFVTPGDLLYCATLSNTGTLP